MERLEQLRRWIGESVSRRLAIPALVLILLLLVTSGLSHLPPIKVVTILAGVLHFSLPLFILSAIVARGARFFALAWLLRRYGEPIRHFIEERLGLIAAAAAAVVILLYLVIRYGL